MSHNNYNKLEECSEYINRIWKEYLDEINRKPKDHHIFLNDLKRVENINAEYENEIFINKKFNNISNEKIDSYFDLEDCNFVPTETLPKEKVTEIFRYITRHDTIPEWDFLEKKLSDFSNYLLYSSVDLDKYKKELKSKKKDTINILILGAGPTGLFIANYLDKINLISPRTNLLVLDNRIIRTKKGLRLPFTRNRAFGLNFDLFSEFSDKMPCIRDLIKRGMVQIKYLENLLIVLAYGYEIPIYFTNEVLDQTHLENFCKENKIDVVFDCTGNRLKTNYFSDVKIDNFFPKDMIFQNKNYQVNIDGNEARLVWKDNIKNKYYLHTELYDKDGKFVRFGLWPNEIRFEEDLEFFLGLKDKCIKVKKDRLDQIIDLFENIKDLTLSKDIQTSLLYSINYRMKFMIVDTKIYHKLKISKVIQQQNQNTLYIGAGDTIFSSSWIIGAGLNRLLNFIKQPIWSLQMLSHELT